MARFNKLNLAAGLGAVALVSGMVLQMSSAAFTGSTSNAGNSWDAGTVSLSDNKSGSALFSATGLKPTDNVSNCIQVTYNGSITPSGAIDLAASVTNTTVGGNGLGDDLDVTVTMGLAGTTCALPGVGTTVYTGTLAGLATAQDTWTPVVGVDTMRPFTFSVTLGNDTANDAQGEGADATFTWSATS